MGYLDISNAKVQLHDFMKQILHYLAGAISSFATMFSKLSNLKYVHFFSRVNIQDFSKCRLLQDCCMWERVKQAE